MPWRSHSSGGFKRGEPRAWHRWRQYGKRGCGAATQFHENVDWQRWGATSFGGKSARPGHSDLYIRICQLHVHLHGPIGERLYFSRRLWKHKGYLCDLNNLSHVSCPFVHDLHLVKVRGSMICALRTVPWRWRCRSWSPWLWMPRAPPSRLPWVLWNRPCRSAPWRGCWSMPVPIFLKCFGLHWYMSQRDPNHIICLANITLQELHHGF